MLCSAMYRLRFARKLKTMFWERRGPAFRWEQLLLDSPLLRLKTCLWLVGLIEGRSGAKICSSSPFGLVIGCGDRSLESGSWLHLGWKAKSILKFRGSRAFPGRAWPRVPLNGSSPKNGTKFTQNQPRRPVLRPFRGQLKVQPPDCADAASGRQWGRCNSFPPWGIDGLSRRESPSTHQGWVELRQLRRRWKAPFAQSQMLPRRTPGWSHQSKHRDLFVELCTAELGRAVAEGVLSSFPITLFLTVAIPFGAQANCNVHFPGSGDGVDLWPKTRERLRNGLRIGFWD